MCVNPCDYNTQCWLKCQHLFVWVNKVIAWWSVRSYTFFIANKLSKSEKIMQHFLFWIETVQTQTWCAKELLSTHTHTIRGGVGFIVLALHKESHYAPHYRRCEFFSFSSFLSFSLPFSHSLILSSFLSSSAIFFFFLHQDRFEGALNCPVKKKGVSRAALTYLLGFS